MKPKIIKITINKAKATIQYSGKLGFNMEAIEIMGFKDREAFLFAEDEEVKDILYLIPTTSNEGDAKISKSGDYFYLNVGDAFKNLGYKYQEYTIMFEVEKGTYENNDIFILKNKREIKRRKKQSEEKGGNGINEE